MHHQNACKQQRSKRSRRVPVSSFSMPHYGGDIARSGFAAHAEGAEDHGIWTNAFVCEVLDDIDLASRMHVTSNRTAAWVSSSSRLRVERSMRTSLSLAILPRESLTELSVELGRVGPRTQHIERQLQGDRCICLGGRGQLQCRLRLQLGQLRFRWLLVG